MKCSPPRLNKSASAIRFGTLLGGSMAKPGRIWFAADVEFFADHPALDDAAVGLYFRMLAAAKKARKGMLTFADIVALRPTNSLPIEALIADNLIVETEFDVFEVVGYDDWYPHDAKALDLHEKRAAAGRKGGLASKGVPKSKRTAKTTPDQVNKQQTNRKRVRSNSNEQQTSFAVTANSGSEQVDQQQTNSIEESSRELTTRGTPPAPAKLRMLAAPKDREVPPCSEERRPVFEAVCAVTSNNWRELSTKDARRVNTAVADILQGSPDATPAEVHLRATTFRTRYKGATLTDMALAKHWASLGVEAVSSAPKCSVAECEIIPGAYHCGRKLPTECPLPKRERYGA